MKDYEKFIHCYDAGEFKLCADIIHEYIDSKYSTTIPLPVALKTNFESLLQDLHPSGYPISNQLEFVGLCERIYTTLVVGPGNPTVNN